MLCSRTLLFILPTYKHLHLLTPPSHSIPPHPSFVANTSLLSTSVSKHAFVSNILNRMVCLNQWQWALPDRFSHPSIKGSPLLNLWNLTRASWSTGESQLSKKKKKFWFPTLEVPKCISTWWHKQRRSYEHRRPVPKDEGPLGPSKALGTGHQASCSPSHEDPPHSEGWATSHHPQPEEILKCWKDISSHFIFVMPYFR